MLAARHDDDDDDDDIKFSETPNLSIYLSVYIHKIN